MEPIVCGVLCDQKRWIIVGFRRFKMKTERETNAVINLTDIFNKWKRG